MSGQGKAPIMLDTPAGRMTLREWAEMNGENSFTVYSRMKRQGITDPVEMVKPQKCGNPNWGTWEPGRPRLTEEKKDELRYLASFSRGQPEQMEMLCDFVPCSRRWADWLKKELGL